MTRAWLVMAVLAAASPAFAQAPGEVPPTPSPASAPTPDPVMATRWAVDLALGGMSYSADGNPPIGFGIAELALRFHATHHVELELALGAGSGKQDQLMAQADQVGYGRFDLRYRFAPERRWNWWLEGGLGILGETPKGADSQQRQDAQRLLGELAIGLERRFGAFALDADLRAYAIGPPRAPAPLSPEPGPIVINTMVSTGAPASGTQLSIGASYYF